MTSNELEAEERTDQEPRDVRALTEFMTVLEDQGRVRGADDLYLVVSASGSEYLVDALEGACECPDHEYRGEFCKHARRVEFATGRRSVPAGVDCVDPQLGNHVAGNVRFEEDDDVGEETDESSGDGCGRELDNLSTSIDEARAVTTDGGMIEASGDEAPTPPPAFTFHVEPEEQGGEASSGAGVAAVKSFVRLASIGSLTRTSVGTTSALMRARLTNDRLLGSRRPPSPRGHP